jgi:hypothetical protein
MFILFAGSFDNIKGGASDIVGFFDTIEECYEAAKQKHYSSSNKIELESYDWAEVLDLTTRETMALTI